MIHSASGSSSQLQALQPLHILRRKVLQLRMLLLLDHHTLAYTPPPCTPSLAELGDDIPSKRVLCSMHPDYLRENHTPMDCPAIWFNAFTLFSIPVIRSLRILKVVCVESNLAMAVCIDWFINRILCSTFDFNVCRVILLACRCQVRCWCSL